MFYFWPKLEFQNINYYVQGEKRVVEIMIYKKCDRVTQSTDIHFLALFLCRVFRSVHVVLRFPFSASCVAFSVLCILCRVFRVYFRIFQIEKVIPLVKYQCNTVHANIRKKYDRKNGEKDQDLFLTPEKCTRKNDGRAKSTDIQF